MPDSTNVSTGKPKVSGAVYTAPAGTALPTDATTALAEAYAELGYVSEDGVSNNNTPESNDIKDWGGQTVLTVEDSLTDEFTFTLIESLNPAVLKARYGSSKVTVNGQNIAVAVDGAKVPEAVWVFDVVMRGGALKRIVIPNGSIKSVGEVVYKANEAIGYPITLAALPDANGVNHHEYINLGSA